MQGATQSSGTIPKPTAATTVGTKRRAVSKRAATRKRRNVKLRFSDLVYVALCCGIGGEIIGFARAGIKCRAFWDICHLCVHVVSQYCDGLPITDTVHSNKVVPWLNNQFATHVVTASFPCTANTTLNPGATKNDPAHKIAISAVRRAIELCALVIVLENVPAMATRKSSSRTYKTILKMFRDAGYATRSYVMDSNRCGGLTARSRLIICGANQPISFHCAM